MSDTVHLLRPCVGVSSIHQLYQIQSFERRITSGPGKGCAYLTTRSIPKRVNDLINGGSVYWVMKGQIRVRQRIEDIQIETDEGGRRFALFLLDPELICLSPRAQRPFQGWRYLTPDKAPKDARVFDPEQAAEEPPEEMAKELSELGLL